MDDSINTGARPSQQNLQLTDTTIADQKLQETAGVHTPLADPTKSTLSASEAMPDISAKGYAAKSGQPTLPVPATVSPADAQGGLNLIEDVPALMTHLGAMMVVLNGPPDNSPQAKALDNLAKLQESLPTSENSDVGNFASKAGIDPKSAAKIIQSAGVNATLNISSGLAVLILQLLKEYQLTGNLDPKVGTLLQDAFQEVLGKIKTPVTADQMKALVTAFLKNPNDQSIPADIRALLQALLPAVMATLNAAITSIKGDTTANAPVASAPVSEVAKQMSTDGFNTAKDIVSIQQNQVNSMPDGPTKMVLTNYLKLIGECIDNLMQQIYDSESQQSQLSNRMNYATMMMQKDSLDIQQAAVNKQRDDQSHEKHSKFVDFFKNSSPILQKIMIAAFAVSTGGLGIAIAATFIARPDLFNDLNRAIDTGMKALANKIGGPGADAFGKFLSVYIASSVQMMLGGGNPMLLIALTTQTPDKNKPYSGGLVANFCKNCNVSDNDTTIVLAVVNGTAQIAMAIAMAVLTGGASAAAAGAEIAATIAETIAIAGIAAEQVTTFAQIVMVSFTIVMTSMSLASQGMTINNDLIEVAIAKLRAQTEATIDKIEALVEILKKAVQALLDALMGNPDLLVDLSKFQQSKYDDASAQTTQAFQA